MITDYVIYHFQPIMGIIIGLILVGTSAYFYHKMDKKIKENNNISLHNYSTNYSFIKTLCSLGIAFGGIMIIVAIKFLSS